MPLFPRNSAAGIPGSRAVAAPTWLGVYLVLAGLVGLAEPIAAQEDASGYRVGPKDLLEVSVYEAPELDTTVRVSEEGAIRLPVAGEVEVAGLTERQLTRKLEGVFEQCCVQRATVSVEILEFRSRPISVIGAVNKPGPLPLSGEWTLLEVLTAAGGLASRHGDVVHVLRRAENGLSAQLTIRLDDLLVRGDRRMNIPIFSNDLVNVPAKVEVTLYCLGEVERPGAQTFQSTERVTLLTAIARAGGPTDRASRKITVKRSSPDGETVEIEADYRKILAGKAPDVELQAGDIVYVKESFF
ncbi:MAG: polysaccharide biosynthesis/export family protein [Thermoanaerobaculia bacterium]|nr:polysaccharide biosynthesis/export family protein [Thermoanaerobaculia bacterium]